LSNVKGKEDDNLEKQNAETSTVPSTGQDSESPADKQAEMTDTPATGLGPVGEAEVEAQKATEGLFPEAA